MFDILGYKTAFNSGACSTRNMCS